MVENNMENFHVMYEENARMLRFFLTWRQIMFSGYFAIIAALAICFKWGLIHCCHYSILFPTLGFFISIAFFLFDLRNRDLFMHTTNVGKNIEEKMEEGFRAYFTEYCNRTPKVRHGWILNTVYLGTALLMFLVAIYGLIYGYAGVMN